MRTVAFWLSLLLIFTIPWENASNIPGVTVSRPVGLFVAAFWLVTVIGTGKIREPRLFHLLAFLFVIWNTASIFWSINVNETVERVGTYLQLLGLIAMIWDLYSTKTALNAALQAYVLGAYVSIYSLMNTYRTYFAVSEHFSRTVGAGGFNLNDLATIVVLGMPLAWYLGTSPIKKQPIAYVLRLVNFAYIPAACWCILVTGSRSASVSLLIVFLYMLGSLTRLKLFTRISIFALLIAAVLAVQPFIPQQSTDRLLATGSQVAEGDLNQRQDIWKEGLDIFLKNPLIGIGSKGYASATEYGKAPHNFALGVLVDTGLIGFALFMGILGLLTYQAGCQPKWQAQLWLTMLLIWVLGALTHNLEYRKQTWVLFTLIVVSDSLFTQRNQLKNAINSLYHSRKANIKT